MRVLVTGSTGVLGRHVIASCARVAPDVTVIRSQANLTDIDQIQTEVEKAAPLDKVIHLAAVVQVASVNAHPERAYAVNVGGTLNLLLALEKSKAAFVYCSTSHVYAPSPLPLSEDAKKGPTTLYGRTKWAAESAASDICNAVGRPFLAARIFSIHDSAQIGSYLRPSIESRLANEDLSLPFYLPGGDSIRDFLPAERAGELLVRLAFSSAAGPVNVASGQGTKIRDFVQKLSPKQLDIRAEGAADTLLADISRLKHFLGGLDD